MKLLVLGANGQVGRELRRALASLGTVLAASRDGRIDGEPGGIQADLAQPASLPAALEAAAPDVIVNAAAYTAVDRAEDEEALAHIINGEALAAMGQWASQHAVPVLHYSTDYVFDGQSRQRWREGDAVAPLGAYGRSKLAGEQALRNSGAEHLILRTAWVYAAHGHNFLRTMLRLAGERDRLTVVDDQHGTPTPARLIADVTAQVLQRWLAADDRAALAGTYHLVAAGQTTWYGFARAIMQRAAAAGLIERAPEVVAVDSSAFPTKATRPAWSVLDTHKLERNFDITLPDWQNALDTVIGELTA
ncbi:dTDP-4-dehydrorhamnose reductase [Oleiagrimonas sp. C23AA]|uniref:dTDP-4-dehydrorhamnose reductase n=1 Tax=Oleiagrimonas sp. C23AA TaxID=2719047 RepID=UPI00141E2028|nr:dTDP-4-dehydrorhamnose reductase [Oleiagrimonas sp. C23AA]NII12369.1 dTDP-4-dehydrorhamnose reductase [Oleiagrimonas sp. C23AA]